MEPLRPEISICLQDALRLQDEDEVEPMLTHPYHPAYDPSAPDPTYDPTALARYDIERGWARFHPTTNADIKSETRIL
jgi:hypothetical protein